MHGKTSTISTFTPFVLSAVEGLLGVFNMRTTVTEPNQSITLLRKTESTIRVFLN